jgi:hypothetical protein
LPSELPIACSLSASDLSTRLREMAELGEAALLEVRHEPARAELRFAAAAGVRDRVERIATAESRCCPFLALRVEDEPGTVVLLVQAPDDAKPVLRELLDAFRDPPQAA